MLDARICRKMARMHVSSNPWSIEMQDYTPSLKASTGDVKQVLWAHASSGGRIAICVAGQSDSTSPLWLELTDDYGHISMVPWCLNNQNGSLLGLYGKIATLVVSLPFLSQIDYFKPPKIGNSPKACAIWLLAILAVSLLPNDGSSRFSGTGASFVG